jgi:hypothetical protein
VVYICQGDTVNWTVHSTGGIGKLTVYQRDGVLKQAGTSAPKWFHASEGTKSKDGTTDDATPIGNWEYAVAVYENNSGTVRVYAHDPKIIIGKGSRSPTGKSKGAAPTK